MKIFVYEHITSGALINESLPASLAHEGNEMLTAIVHDMSLLTDIELTILRDFRLEPLLDIIDSVHHQCLIIDDYSTFQQHYASSVKEADAVLIIAPETDGLLQNLQQTVLNQHKQLLGCHPTATQTCTDKVISHRQLTSNNVLTPHTITATEWSLNPFNSPSGFIVKPRDGAGCIDTFFFSTQTTLTAWLISSSITLEQTIIQPYIEGNAISVSALVDDKASRVLAINQQHIKLDNGQFNFHGCCVNGITEAQFSLMQATKIVRKTHHAIPGLWGFIGIDLIITDNEAYIVEINPRVTTPYVGLRESLNLNPAQLLMTMMKQGLSGLPINTQRNAIEILI
jgi:predicted ATP-grasp superfamily ATP-dependent carboligase